MLVASFVGALVGVAGVESWGYTGQDQLEIMYIKVMMCCTKVCGDFFQVLHQFLPSRRGFRQTLSDVYSV